MTKPQNYLPKTLLSLIVISAFLLMLGPAKQDSAIMDELAHIPAGYSYVKYFDYRLNPEHPPLVKALSALPLLFQNLNFPLDKSSWQADVNGQWAAGTQFIYESGNDANKIIFYSRLIPMLLLLILIGFTYFWSSELMGKWWALLPATLIAFSPNFLAHGHYVTTDVGASLGFLISIYYFLKYVYKPTKKNIIIAGLTFGIAELLKFSTVLLGPLFIIIIGIIFLEKTIKTIKSPLAEGKLKKIAKYFCNDFGQLILIFLIGGLLIYLVYALFTVNYPIEKQYSDTGAILQSFGNRYIADSVIAMSQNKIFRPLGEYLLGVLMVMQRSAGGNTAYFLGEVSGGGNNFYFPIVFIIKEALPTLIIIFIALFLSLGNILRTVIKGKNNIKNKFSEYLTTNFSEFSMLIFVVGYWLYSMKSSLNIGFRHIIPTLPFIYILSALAIKKLFYIIPRTINDGLAQNFLNIINKILNLGTKLIILAGLLIWLVISALNTNPYYLPRFNEVFGGTFDGYKYVTDSNFDWGQDLKRLKDFVNNPPDGEKIEKIAVDYFGGGNPRYYLGDKAENWNSAMGNPTENGIKWLAVSVNTIQNAIAKITPDTSRGLQDEYGWLKNPLLPDYKAGTSIFIYKLADQN